MKSAETMIFDIANLAVIDDLLQCAAIGLVAVAAILRAAKKRDLAIDLLYFSVALCILYIARNW